MQEFSTFEVLEHLQPSIKVRAKKGGGYDSPRFLSDLFIVGH